MSKYANKRMHVRGSGGRFRKTTGADFGIGGTCEKCRGFLIRHYDGDPREAHPDPRNFRFRCFTCEPKTDTEKALEAEIEASKPKRVGFGDVLLGWIERDEKGGSN